MNPVGVLMAIAFFACAPAQAVELNKSHSNLTADQVLKILEDQVGLLAGFELEWKRNLHSEPNLAMADHVARKRAALEKKIPATHDEAVRQELDIRNNKSFEDSLRNPSDDESLWMFNLRSLTDFHGESHRIEKGRQVTSTEYFGKAADGGYPEVFHDFRIINLKDRSSVLLNTLGACPPLTVLYQAQLLKDRVTAKFEWQIEEIAKANQVTLVLKQDDHKALSAIFSVPEWKCQRIGIFRADGGERERYEVPDGTPAIPELPFLPQTCIHTVGDPQKPMWMSVWRFVKVTPVRPEGRKDFKLLPGFSVQR